ncbi:MAG: hypothetical protein IKN91_09565 [Paludibacteraceae bacterium]|nr:hypothetical protein [Paludibacteraceae bacterium]
MRDSDKRTTSKLHEGLTLTTQRLLEHKRSTDGTLIVADDNGNIQAVQARDIEL